jgi:uncharacterized protein YdcH (DUF465 family)
MQLDTHTLLSEFPDHHHTIRHLKMHNAHFTKLSDSYHDVESKLHRIEENNSPLTMII